MELKITHKILACSLLLSPLLTGCVTSHDYIRVNNNYHLVVDKNEDLDYAYQINDALEYYSHFDLAMVPGTGPVSDYEIVFDLKRPEVQEVVKGLKADEYALVAKQRKIIVGYTSNISRMCAVDHLLTKYASKDGLVVPVRLNEKGKCALKDKVIEITLPEDVEGDYRNIRDPFILNAGDDGFYMYGTTEWAGIEWRAYHADKLDGKWTNIGKVAEIEAPYPDIKEQRWAPEVHKYKGKYYMFTTYCSNATNQRGVTILKSDSPSGPFEIISYHPNNQVQPGHITDDQFGCTIDGTLYVDPHGQPWLVFVNEWVSQPDGVGSFSAARLSDDLTHLVSEPVELFRADDAPWGTSGVTDGCFMHTLPNGKLFMLWSKSNRKGYATGYATSDDLLTGWTQHDRLLFAKDMMYPDSPEGGHSMFFNVGEQMYMCQHGPNGGDTEHPFVVPVKDAYGTVVWDLYE